MRIIIIITMRSPAPPRSLARSLSEDARGNSVRLATSRSMFEFERCYGAERAVRRNCRALVLRTANGAVRSRAARHSAKLSYLLFLIMLYQYTAHTRRETRRTGGRARRARDPVERGNVALSKPPIVPDHYRRTQVQQAVIKRSRCGAHVPK